MTAHPAYDSDPDDPVEILDALPEEHRRQFRAEYAAAVDGARQPEQFRELHAMLRLWRLRAVAYSDPGYDGRLAAAQDARPADSTPAERLIPSWPSDHNCR